VGNIRQRILKVVASHCLLKNISIFVLIKITRGLPFNVTSYNISKVMSQLLGAKNGKHSQSRLAINEKLKKNYL